MNPYPINFIISEDTQGKLTTSPNAVTVGRQYENNAHKLVFTRPYGRESDDLILYFKTGRRTYRINISINNEYLIGKMLTIHNTLQLQVAFVKGFQETSLSSVSLLGFECSIDKERDPLRILTRSSFSSVGNSDEGIVFKNILGEVVGTIPSAEVYVDINIPFNIENENPDWDSIPIPTLEEYNDYISNYQTKGKFLITSNTNSADTNSSFICYPREINYNTTTTENSDGGVSQVLTTSFISFSFNYGTKWYSLMFAKDENDVITRTPNIVTDTHTLDEVVGTGNKVTAGKGIYFEDYPQSGEYYSFGNIDGAGLDSTYYLAENTSLSKSVYKSGEVSQSIENTSTSEKVSHTLNFGVNTQSNEVVVTYTADDKVKQAIIKGLGIDTLIDNLKTEIIAEINRN